MTLQVGLYPMNEGGGNSKLAILL